MEKESIAPRWEIWYSQYRSFLIALAYRLLGSLHDAEDIVQETYLQARPYAAREIENPRALLAKITTNRCLDVIKSGKTRKERQSGTWLPEPLPTDMPLSYGLEEYVIQKDTLSIAALLLLERLNPVDRAVYVLREVFEWKYEDIANIVDRTEPACRKIYSRAKIKINTNPKATTGSEPVQPFVNSLLTALSEGELAPFVRLLSQDVILYTDRASDVRTATKPIASAGYVAAYLTGLLNITTKTLGPLSYQIVAVNGTPALLATSGKILRGVIALHVESSMISSIYVYRNPEKLSIIGQAYGLHPFR